MGAFLDVFGGGNDIRPLDEPGVCVICNAAPDQSVTKVINTGRILPMRPGVALQGRIYVCGDCASDLGKAVGQHDADEFDQVVAEHESVSQQLAEANDKIAAFAAVESALAMLQPQVAAVPAADVTTSPDPTTTTEAQ